MNNTIQKKEGFTIIEVVLVLAVAALIMLMVFIALPAMQRNQRDQQRQQDVSRLQAAVQSYKGRNNGSLPTDWSNFFDEYMKRDGDQFADPRAGEYQANATSTVPSTIPGYDDNTATIYIYLGATCNGEEVNAGTGGRRAALVLPLEGGGRTCQEA